MLYFPNAVKIKYMNDHWVYQLIRNKNTGIVLFVWLCVQNLVAGSILAACVTNQINQFSDHYSNVVRLSFRKVDKKFDSAW